LIINLATLGRRPCGACRALVPSDTGCKHWRPGAPLKDRTKRLTRSRLVIRPEGRRPLDENWRFQRFIKSVSQRTLLARLLAAPERTIDLKGQPRHISTAGRLVQNGLAERLGGGSYRATDEGLSTHERAQNHGG